RLLRAADAFVLASLWEGFPNVVIEAMAAGLPVVATATGGVGEIIEQPLSGLIVKPGDAAALATAMAAMTAMERAMRTRMGRFARQTVAERFTLERTVAETERL